MYLLNTIKNIKWSPLALSPKFFQLFLAWLKFTLREILQDGHKCTVSPEFLQVQNFFYSMASQPQNYYPLGLGDPLLCTTILHIAFLTTNH